MNRLMYLASRVLQENPPTPGEWGIIFTLLTVLGTIINILYTNRNSLVQQQREMIAYQQVKIEGIEKDCQTLRSDFAVSERRRIELEGDVQVLKDKYHREKLKVKSLKRRLTQKQKRILRGGKKI